MNPIPLTDPTGALRAWICGCCLHVGHGSEALGRNADESIVASSRARAESCCVCRDCGGPAPRAASMSLLGCAACDAKRNAEIEAREAELAKTHDKCAHCDGSGDDWERVDIDCADCLACNGSGWVKRTEATR